MSPIIVYVSTKEWRVAPLDGGNRLSPWDKFLVKEIKMKGGIDKSVPPGIYHFNIVRVNGVEQAILVPAPL